MARVLVIDDDAGLLQMVKLMLEREGHQAMLAEGGDAGIQAALTQVPDVAIVDLMMPGISGYDVTRQLRADARTARMPILILTARSQPMDKQMAVNAGATAFMSKPVSSRELTARIADILAGKVATSVPVAPHRQAAEASPTAPPPSPIRRLPIGIDSASSAAPAQPAPAARTAEKPAQAPITAVMALRGGSGVTTLTINLAFLLRRTYERVGIIDLGMMGGHVAQYLHLQPRASWADLLTLGERFDARAVGAIITPHPQQGIGVISAPTQPPAQPLSPESTIRLLSALAAGFQQVVINVGGLNPSSAAALAGARSVLVVVGDDQAAVQSSSNLPQTLQSVNVEMKNVRVVVNHNRPEPGLPVAAIAKAIGFPISAELPYDVNQLQAMRRGVPTVVMAPESAFALALLQFSRTL